MELTGVFTFQTALFLLSDYLLTGNNLLLRIRFAGQCSLCRPETSFTIRELRVLVIYNLSGFVAYI